MGQRKSLTEEQLLLWWMLQKVYEEKFPKKAVGSFVCLSDLEYLSKGGIVFLTVFNERQLM